jgi:hypothetical protein
VTGDPCSLADAEVRSLDVDQAWLGTFTTKMNKDTGCQPWGRLWFVRGKFQIYLFI